MPIATPPRPGDAPPATARRRSRLSPVSVSPEAWLTIGLTAVAGLLRFATLTSQSFWLDEATTVHEVGLSLGGMLHATALNETTPPLYFVVAWVWTRLFGAGEFGLRSLSALAGTAIIPVSYLCGRELVSRRAGLVAAALTTFSPFLIWYSQEGRSYMLFALFSALSFLFWARCLRSRARGDLAAWAVFSALAVLTHFYAVFLVAPEAVWLLWHRRERATVIAVTAVAAVQLAVLPIAIADTSHPLFWIRAFALSVRIEQIPADLGASQLFKSPGITWGLPGAGILAALVLALLIYGGGRATRVGAARAGAMAACVLLIPIGLAELGHDYVFSRNFVAAWIPLSVVLGAACTAPRARIAGGCLLAVLIAGFIWTSVKIDGDPAYQRPAWRDVAAALGPAGSERAIVTLQGNAAEQPLSVYLPRTGFSYSGVPASESPVSVSEVDVVGDPLESVSPHLLGGVRLLGVRVAGGSLIARFRMDPAWHMEPIGIARLASLLLSPRPPQRPAVLIQRPPGQG